MYVTSKAEWYRKRAKWHGKRARALLERGASPNVVYQEAFDAFHFARAAVDWEPSEERSRVVPFRFTEVRL